MIDLVESLVRSRALRIAPPGEVFWYTSGTVGPYYIRTEYLFGGPEPAEDLLAFIDDTSRAPDFHARLRRRIGRHLAEDPDYAAVIQALAESIGAREAATPPADWISGGERRDWFFSLAVAEVAGRPHLYLYKNGDVLAAIGDVMTAVGDLAGQRTAHVADLVTEASSYERAWIPAIRVRGGEMAISTNVIDRAQGGMAVVAAAGVDATALLHVDEALFADLLHRGLIDDDQHALLVDYLRDPTGAMRRFLMANPAFLERDLISSDARTARRARMLVERDPYGLRN